MEKLTRNEFFNLTTHRFTDYGIFFETKTDICKYGQAYKGQDESLQDKYTESYYKMYLEDFDNKEDLEDEE